MDISRRTILFICGILGAVMASSAQAPPPLAERIGHTDPSRYRRSRSHGSEGDMACMTLVPRNAIPLLNFVHRCQMTAPKGGVGHHFHNRNEEMFVIFDGEAEFTIDGRASLLKGTVGAPVRMGHSHAIVNPTDRPIEFMNINVASDQRRVRRVRSPGLARRCAKRSRIRCS